MDKTPATIGKYRILRVLGRGGMGSVYEALDPLINRKVAVKTMIPGLVENAELRERFMREAQAAGGLRHRNIVTVYDLWVDADQPYIAMEFIEGSDLEKLMQQSQGGLGLERKLDILRQVCEGLSYAHKAGIVHRDVKPANIRVTPEGEVKIMDFGIAHLQSSTMTKSGLVLGTVHYMAPEQLIGDKVDHRADVFSVGVIAYELLSGRKPFDGESLTTVMYKIIHDDADVRGLPRTLFSPRLDKMIMHALARRLDERYASLDQMHAELLELVKDAASRDQARRAEEDGLRARVERELRDLRANLHQARAEGQLQKALGLARKLLEVNPDDVEAAREADEIQSSIHDREIEQLCGTSLGYAAEGEFELARRIAERIEKLAPRSPRYLKLRGYLDEESARRKADALTGTAQEHLALGNLAEARAAAEEAMEALPAHALAREIRDRVAAILAVQERHQAEPGPAVEAPADQTVILPRRDAPASTAPAPDADVAATVAAPRRTPVAQKSPAPVEDVDITVALARPPAAPKPAARAPVEDADATVMLSRPSAATAPPTSPVLTPAPGAPQPAPRPAPAATMFPAAPEAPPPAHVLPPKPARSGGRDGSDETRPIALSELRRTTGKPASPPVAPAAPAPAPTQLTPLPEAEPRDPEAARLLESARRLLRERQPGKALPLLEQAVALEAAHPGIERLLRNARDEARRAEIESLTTAALDHFVANRYAKARQAVAKALVLDPANRQAKDLLKILGPLG